MPDSISCKKRIRKVRENRRHKDRTYQFRLSADGNILHVVIWVRMHPD